MNVWLVSVGEELPIDNGARSWRTNMLAERLCVRGHKVVWWTSTFYHQRKRHRFTRDTSVTVREGYEIRLLHAPPYQSNVSLRRLVHQSVTARKFTAASEGEKTPDIIVCSYPTLELSSACTRYGKRHNVPVVIDIQDPWPDVWLTVAPRVLRPLARVLLEPMFSTARRICRDASGIVAVSETYLRWGLRKAGRRRCSLDAVFPLGYDSRGFWEDVGIEDGARQVRDRFGIRADGLVAVFCGTFGHSYDLGTVIEAGRVLEGTDWAGRIQIVLAGDGPRWSALRKKAEGLRNVVFTGWLDGKALRDLMRTAWVGLAPYVEGAGQSLPNKPFEYMAAGLPIISSLPGELEALLRQEGIGLQYKAGDVESLVEAIKFLVEHPDKRRRMAIRSRMLFERRFAVDVIYPRYVEHLEQVVRK